MRVRALLAVAAAYALACLAAAAMIALWGAVAGGSGPMVFFDGGTFVRFLSMTGFIAFYTAPGFVFVRAMLHGFGLRHWAFFALGGAGASVIALKMFYAGLEPDPGLAVIGAAAAVAYLRAERAALATGMAARGMETQ